MKGRHESTHIARIGSGLEAQARTSSFSESKRRIYFRDSSTLARDDYGILRDISPSDMRDIRCVITGSCYVDIIYLTSILRMDVSLYNKLL